MTEHTDLDDLLARRLADGGFSGQIGGSYRPDATAWAVLALRADDRHPDIVNAGLDRLSRSQLKDGRVSMDASYPQAYWPTSEAVLAWHGHDAYRASFDRAVRFLLSASGKQYRYKDKTIVGHDASIRGWPWIDGTHS